MPKSTYILQHGSVDETDRMPTNIHISTLDIIMYVVAIVGHFADLAVDINIAVRYYMAGKSTEFGWTIAFILVPALVNTAVSVRMYVQDKSNEDSVSNIITKQKGLRIFILVFQMAPILRFTDALIYALKSREAEKQHDVSTQQRYYKLMLKEDSDAALLRIFECFLEAAPQQVLQTTFLLKRDDEFTVHQILSITSSIVSMAWCLAAYQRAIRYAQEDKLNVTWCGTILQIMWHFFVTLSRITSLSMIAYMFPSWTIVAATVHVTVMASWLQIFDRSPFCLQNKFLELAFSLTLGSVYIFTYILPIEGKTRYRYTFYYTVCFFENIVCAVLWCFFLDDKLRSSYLFFPFIAMTFVPFLLGIAFMVIYYAFLHPRVRKRVRDMSVSFKNKDQDIEFVS